MLCVILYVVLCLLRVVAVAGNLCLKSIEKALEKYYRPRCLCKVNNHAVITGAVVTGG